VCIVFVVSHHPFLGGSDDDDNDAAARSAASNSSKASNKSSSAGDDVPAAAVAAAEPAPLSEQQNKWLEVLLEQPECPVCLDAIEAPAITDCNHAFCYDCVMNLLNGDAAQRRCPLCRRDIRLDTVHKLVVEGLGAINRAAAAKRDAALDGAADDDADDEDGDGDDDDGDGADVHARTLALAIRAAKSLAAVAQGNGANGGQRASSDVRERQRERAHRAVERLRAMLSNSRSASRELRDIMATLRAHQKNAKMVRATFRVSVVCCFQQPTLDLGGVA
jgi:hypothetical protein